MVRLPLLPLPKSNEGKLALFSTVASLVLLVLLTRAQTQLDAKPVVEDFKVDARTEDVRRGTVAIKRKSVTEPDGTKTVESERIIGPVESHTTSNAESSRRETPIGLLARPRTRYAGLSVPIAAFAQPRLARPTVSLGLTIWGAWDGGLGIDTAKMAKPTDLPEALRLETRYRF